MAVPQSVVLLSRHSSTHVSPTCSTPDLPLALRDICRVRGVDSSVRRKNVIAATVIMGFVLVTYGYTVGADHHPRAHTALPLLAHEGAHRTPHDDRSPYTPTHILCRMCCISRSAVALISSHARLAQSHGAFLPHSAACNAQYLTLTERAHTCTYTHILSHYHNCSHPYLNQPTHRDKTPIIQMYAVKQEDFSDIKPADRAEPTHPAPRK